MRIVSRLCLFGLSALVLLGSFGFALRPVHAQSTPATPTSANSEPAEAVSDIGANAIFGTGGQGAGASGLIFANICTAPRPSEGRGDTCACRASGDCTLDDIMQVFVNVTILILSISGSIILLMFVYGGFMWVTAHGDMKRVENGKETITNAVIGFAIIMLAYSMINFAVALLAGDTQGSTIEETLQNAGDGVAQ